MATLYNYGSLLEGVRQNYSGSEEMYKRVLARDPNHSTTLSNYGGLLHTVCLGIFFVWIFFWQKSDKILGVLGNFLKRFLLSQTTPLPYLIMPDFFTMRVFLCVGYWRNEDEFESDFRCTCIYTHVCVCLYTHVYIMI